MAKENGRNGWIMWLAGVLVSLVVMIALPTMAKGIIDNDIKNTGQHQKIMETMIERDEKIQTSINIFSVEQMRQRTLLERIDRKL